MKKVEELKQSKGKSAAIFNVMGKIRGLKKQGPEMVAMKDSESGDMIFEPEALKKASINYCANLLQNTEVDSDYKHEIDIENLIHYLLSKEDNQDDDTLQYTDFLYKTQEHIC